MMHFTNELVAHAADYAKIIHASQSRKYTGEPYFVHLVEVGVTLKWAGCDPEVVAAGFLHDSIEDQGQTVVGLEQRFGARVARLVDEVSDVSKPSDGNRAFRKKLDALHLSHASPDGMSIKLADLISNSRSITQHDPNFARVYLHEKNNLLPLLKRGNTVLWELAAEQIK